LLSLQRRGRDARLREKGEMLRREVVGRSRGTAYAAIVIRVRRVRPVIVVSMPLRKFKHRIGHDERCHAMSVKNLKAISQLSVNFACGRASLLCGC